MRVYEKFDKTSENREPSRAYYIPYDSLEKALDGKKENSAYYKLLNGLWNFKYFERDIDVPETTSGGICKIETSTGNIRIKIK